MMTIRRQLLIGLLCALALCALGAGVALYYAMLKETSELGDLQLRQVAAALPNEFGPGTALPGAEDPEEDVVVQAWDERGAPRQVAQEVPLLPRYDVRGYKSVQFNGAGWRIYGERRRALYVQVAQSDAVRAQVATRRAMYIGWPVLACLIVLAGFILMVVERALKPLDRLAQAVAGRSPEALQPLPTDALPPELRQVVDALNGLMRKFERALTQQRTFVADAAHELRSPLTALKLQLQLVERAAGADARTAALAKLEERLDRGVHLVQQLLSLARHEVGHQPGQRLDIDLSSLLQAAVIDHEVLAASRGIDLGVASDEHIVIAADPEGLRVLLNNLVDNALRYTQPGGRVDVRAGRRGGRAWLQVQDNGPGVPEQDRARLFDRCYRPAGNTVPGCGLGLSIVRNIADHHGASVEIAAADWGGGLSVTVLFPAADTAADLH
ncbi:ATP-binding protein [Pseudoduganella aquatica]|uniref:ATP-binding protein n=1 Tax=Pseudoduganella aquatica TaxID=2660641 RepID=UPI001E4B8630|nr:ATP-binding protein [Pseudoduganella aquatica]